MKKVHTQRQWSHNCGKEESKTNIELNHKKPNAWSFLIVRQLFLTTNLSGDEQQMDQSLHVFKTIQLFAILLLLLLLFLQLLLQNSNISSVNEPYYIWIVRYEAEGDHRQVVNALQLLVYGIWRAKINEQWWQ